MHIYSKADISYSNKVVIIKNRINFYKFDIEGGNLLDKKEYCVNLLPIKNLHFRWNTVAVHRPQYISDKTQSVHKKR